jgi:dihydrofolate reductase
MIDSDAIRKYVVSHSLENVEQQWNNSKLIDGDLIEAVQRLKLESDLVVMGSISVARGLNQADLVDEYRLLVFPIVLGEGTRLFETGKCTEFEMAEVQRAGSLALVTYRR